MVEKKEVMDWPSMPISGGWDCIANGGFLVLVVAVVCRWMVAFGYVSLA